MTAAHDQVASVYAESLYELATKAGGATKASEVAAELEAIDSAIHAEPAFLEMLRSPMVDRDRRGEALRKVLSGRSSDLVLRTMLVMNRRGRAGEIASLASAYRAILDREEGRLHVTVFTPGEMLGGTLQQLVRDRIKATLGKEAVIEAKADPEMIGGIKLRIGDRLIDGSVATRLRRMRQSLLTQGNPEVRSQFERYVDEAS
ncbi:MAG: ATP synthase F1 subunit delta [Phycisphaerales bacterium]